MSSAPEPSRQKGVSFVEAGMMCLIAAIFSFGAATALAIHLDHRQESRIEAAMPRVATIDIQRLLAGHIADQTAKGLEGDALRDATMAWTRSFNEITWRLYTEAGFVVLDAKSVAAGGEDLTDVVAEALR